MARRETPNKTPWTVEQRALVRKIVVDADRDRVRIDWDYWLSRIGHSKESVLTIARQIRAELRAEKEAA